MMAMVLFALFMVAMVLFALFMMAMVLFALFMMAMVLFAFLMMAMVLSVLPFTASDYPFGIFKLFLSQFLVGNHGNRYTQDEQ
jgi:hypothetical protein